ncbi:hypothetical protein ACFQV2_16095 [Actinokineospora soli]|uniref:Lipoprotein n=1 Tax=Actinokineospora soli TaxID=1048753 RepID=A0ABW2TM15_9PSEU
MSRAGDPARRRSPWPRPPWPSSGAAGRRCTSRSRAGRPRTPLPDLHRTPTTTTSAAPSTTSGVSLLSAEETVQAYVEEINKRDKAAVIKVVCGGKQPGTQFADVTRDRGVVTITGEIDISSWAQVGYVDAAAEYPNAAKPVEFSIEVENGPKGWCIDPD